MITSLTKVEYYRSKNIPVPKIVNRISPEPSVRLHMIDILPNMAFEAMKIIESTNARHGTHIELAQCYKLIQELEQSLFTITNEKYLLEEQIVEYHRREENHQRKFTQLEKEAFSLREINQKSCYEAKAFQEQLQREFEVQTHSWETQCRDLHLALQNMKQNAQEAACSQNGQIQLRMGQMEKDFLIRITSAEAEKEGLMKERERLCVESKRLLDQLIRAESDNIACVGKLQFQNQQLGDKCLKLSNEYERLLAMKMQEDKHARNLLDELEQHMLQLKIINEEQRKAFSYEKTSLESRIRQNQEEFHQRFSDLMASKEAVLTENGRIGKDYFELERVSNRHLRKIQELEEVLKHEQLRWESHLARIQVEHEMNNSNLRSEYEQKHSTFITKAHEDQNLLIAHALNLEKNRHKSLIDDTYREYEAKFKSCNVELENHRNQRAVISHQLEQAVQNAKQSAWYLEENRQKIEMLVANHKKESDNMVSDFEIRARSIQGQVRKRYEEEKIRCTEIIAKKEKEIFELNGSLKSKESKKIEAEKASICYKQRLDKYSEEIQQKNQMIASLDTSVKEKSVQVSNLLRKISELKADFESKQVLLCQTRKENESQFEKLKESDNLRLLSLKKWKEAQDSYLSRQTVLESEQIRLTKNSKVLEGNMELLSSNNLSLKEQITNLEKQLSIYREENMKLKASTKQNVEGNHELMTALKSEFEALSLVQSKQFSEKEKQLMATISQKGQAIIFLQQQLNNLDQGLFANKELTIRKQVEIAQISKELFHHRKLSEESQQHIHALKVELNTFSSKQVELVKAIDQARAGQDHALKELHFKTKEWDAQYAQISTFQQSNRMYTLQLQQKDQLISERNTVITELRRQLQVTHQSVNNTVNELRISTTQRIDSLQSQIQILETQKGQLERKVNEQRNQLQLMHSESGSLQRERQESARKLSECKSSNAELCREIRSLKEEIQAVSKECQVYINRKKEEIAGLEKERNSLIEKSSSQSMRMEEYEKRHQCMRRDYETKLEDTQRRAGSLEEGKASLERQLSSFYKTQQETEASLASIQVEYRRVCEQLQRRERELLEQQIGFKNHLSEMAKAKEEEESQRKGHLEEERQASKQQMNALRVTIMESEGFYMKQVSEWSEKYNSILIKLKSSNKQLVEYKKKWARICGQVTDFSHEISEIDEQQAKIVYTIQSFEASSQLQKEEIQCHTSQKSSHRYESTAGTKKNPAEEPFQKYLNRMTLNREGPIMDRSRGVAFLSESVNSDMLISQSDRARDSLHPSFPANK